VTDIRTVHSGGNNPAKELVEADLIAYRKDAVEHAVVAWYK